jgi:ABC-2 type transport system permease protein
MKPYVSIFRMKFIAGTQYRAAAWAGIATQFFWGFMLLMIYRAFYRSSGTEPPITWRQLVSYIWLNQAFLAAIMLWLTDGELLSGITDGHVAYELCRPYDMYAFWFARLAASRLSSMTLRCLPILTVAFVVPEPFRMTLPPSADALAAFLLSMSLSLFLVTALSMFIYILTFVTMSATGSRLIVGIAAEFLTGQTVPIPLMPEWLQRVLDFLPYRYISDLPFRLYGGNIAGSEALFQVGLQMAWIAALYGLGIIAFKRIMGRVVIQGG